MIWTTQEKHEIFTHNNEYPELARLLKAKNKYEFEGGTQEEN